LQDSSLRRNLSTCIELRCAELILTIRVCSLYGHRKLVTWSLGIFLLVALAGATVTQVRVSQALRLALYYEFLPGCWAWSPSTLTQWPLWVAFMSVEGVLILLTLYKFFSYRKQLNKTITVLSRDSIVYFIILFVCIVMDITIEVDRKFMVNVTFPTQCITSIAVGRLMMNIRGLIMDDPEHTVHLQTLQFAAHTNPGSEIDEVA